MATKQRRTDIDVEKFHQLLLAERARNLGLHEEQRADMLEEAGDASSTELASLDYNDAGEAGAELADYDRDDMQDINLKAELHQIEHALTRYDQGLYGICEVTGEPIPVDRLRAIPWATMTVAAAERIVG